MKKFVVSALTLWDLKEYYIFRITIHILYSHIT